MNMNKVILVDESDVAYGTADKMEVHISGVLHRAFSVFLFDERGRQLLQRRASHKYHTAGLYSNACCSHPAPGETTLQAVSRRLQEELGLQCEVEPLLRMRYRSKVGDGLLEHEFDHVFVGICTQQPQPNPDEVQDVVWVDRQELKDWMAREPEAFTPWFRLAVLEVLESMDRRDADRPARTVMHPDGTVASFMYD